MFCSSRGRGASHSGHTATTGDHFHRAFGALLTALWLIVAGSFLQEPSFWSDNAAVLLCGDPDATWIFMRCRKTEWPRRTSPLCSPLNLLTFLISLLHRPLTSCTDEAGAAGKGVIFREASAGGGLRWGVSEKLYQHKSRLPSANIRGWRECVFVNRQIPSSWLKTCGVKFISL